MNKTQNAVLSFLVPIAGIIIFFNRLNSDRQAAFSALMWAMAGLAIALILFIALGLGHMVNTARI